MGLQALESEAVLGRFRTVYEKMNSALDGMPYAELGVSDEVMEQVNSLTAIAIPGLACRILTFVC